MPHRRQRRKGSFGTHFDELVRHFPEHEPSADGRKERSAELQEKIDIHALLFERAWQMERKDL